MNGRLCWLKFLKISAQSFRFLLANRHPIAQQTRQTFVDIQLQCLRFPLLSHHKYLTSSLFYCYIVRCTWNVLKMSFSLNACVFLDDFLAASYYIVSSVQWFKICSLNVQRFSLQWVCSEHTENTDNFFFELLDENHWTDKNFKGSLHLFKNTENRQNDCREHSTHSAK